MSPRLAAAQRREQLLDICARLVDLEGFHAATIDRVASEAGVTRTVVYQNFGGLDGMYDALVARAVERATQTLSDAGDWDEGAAAGALAAVLAAADADPATWRLFLVVPPAGPPALADALAAGRRALRRQVATGLTGTGTDAELTARLVQAVADEVVRLRLADPGQYDHARLLARFDAVVRPLLQTAPSRPARRRDGGVADRSRTRTR